MDFSVRSQAPELMDGLTDPAEYARCLGDLAQANRLTRTHAPILAWLTRASRGMEGFRLLDVACGHGDLLRAISRLARKRGLAVTLEGIDLNPGSAIAASAATPDDTEIVWRTGDVFDYRPNPKPDFIVSSQFTHHLDGAQLVQLFRWMDTNAARSWYILDLHRHWFAYYGFKLMSWAARWHPIMRHDGAVSVTRGFTRAEIIRAAEGLNVSVSWKLPFRFGIEGRPGQVQ
jgi:2-polyprenyl-3-methyl-5-hydroxy-6-metoxy-1,4-benzoquinol methylase